MKVLLAVLVLGSMQMFSVSAHATVKCEILNIVTHKPMVVTGETQSEVIEKGADLCFKMYSDMTAATKGHNLYDDEAGVTIVNACTNICG